MSIDISISKSERQSTSLWWVHALMILNVFLIASSFPVGELIATALPSDVMMLIRFLMAMLLFLPWVLYRYGLGLPRVKKMLGYGLLSIPLVTFFWCMFEALKTTSAVSTGALFTTLPAITALSSWIVNRERTGLGKSVGLSLGTLGALLIVLKGNVSTELGISEGDGLFFLGVIALGLYNALIKRLYSGEPTEIMTFWVIVFGALWLLLLSLSSFEQVIWQAVPGHVFGALFYLALFTTLISFFLLQFGTVKIGPTQVAAYSFLNPVFVLGLSLALGLAEFTLSMIPGLVLILLAMIIIQRGGREA